MTPKRRASGRRGRPKKAAAQPEQASPESAPPEPVAAAEEEQLTLFDEPEATTEHASGRRAIDDILAEEVMAAIRQACRGRGELERDELLRDVAGRLGFRRLGKSIRERLEGHLRAAVRRKIIAADGRAVWAETHSMDDYTRDELVDAICSVMRRGRAYDRDEVITAVAHHLGFTRVRETVRAPVKSALNAAVRRGVVRREGSMIRRAT